MMKPSYKPRRNAVIIGCAAWIAILFIALVIIALTR